MNNKKIVKTAILLAVSGILAMQGLFIYTVLLSKNGVDYERNRDAALTQANAEDSIIIRNGAAGSHKVTFSCNVDWGEEVIPEMLDVLRENQITITFFVSGKWAEKNPKLLRDMHLAGHEIQSHGYSHKLCTQVSREVVKEEILKTEAAILSVLGIKTTVFAPPSGDFNETTVELCKELGYKMALWSADTIDWREGSTADIITQRVLKKDLDGGIVLMHPKPETVKALPGLIKAMKERGLEIVPLYRLPL
ncbi:MAG: polysaccharide deacetylase family protein [Anaerovoracaceae bacterium]